MVNYKLLCAQMASLTENVPHEVANLANASALIWQTLPDINWAGFYLMQDGALVLGPFQGPLACTRIRKGRGVCGTAWERRETVIVPDVELFPGHIACSSASRSEIVVPVFNGDEVVAVLDIDSEHLATFDETDKLWLEKIVALFARN
jgi:GAF domain-containing protein